MYFRLSALVSLSLVVAAFSSPVKRDVGTIENDLANIQSQTQSLDNAINGFQGTLMGALGITESVTTLSNTINSATNDVNANSPFSAADTNGILNIVEVFVPIIQTTLKDLVNQQNAIAGLPFPDATGIVAQDLQTLQQNADALMAAIMSRIPGQFMSVGQAQVALIDNAFNNAITAYSS